MQVGETLNLLLLHIHYRKYPKHGSPVAPAFALLVDKIFTMAVRLGLPAGKLTVSQAIRSSRTPLLRLL